MTALLVLFGVWQIHANRERSAREALWTATRDDCAAGLADRLVVEADGIEVLVAGLRSPRRAVVEAIGRTLSREVGRWDRLPACEASQKLATLASSLAAVSQGISPEAHRVSADLARRVLLQPTDGTVVERERLVADCTLVLRTVGRKADENVADLAELPLPRGLVEPQPLEREVPAEPERLVAERRTPRRFEPEPGAASLQANERRAVRSEAVSVAAGEVVEEHEIDSHVIRASAIKPVEPAPVEERYR
jgi:hypothetical protein